MSGRASSGRKQVASIWINIQSDMRSMIDRRKDGEDKGES